MPEKEMAKHIAEIRERFLKLSAKTRMQWIQKAVAVLEGQKGGRTAAKRMTPEQRLRRSRKANLAKARKRLAKRPRRRR
jgi:hypothetical protein